MLNKSIKNYLDANFENSENIKNKLMEYKKIILTENLNMNLIGKSTIEDFDNRHLLDCMQIKSYIKSFDRLIADLGSGAGLPGIVLSIMGFKNVNLIEKSPKKSAFLNQCKLRLGLNCNIYNSLIEDIKNINFEVIVARAFAPISKIITFTKHITNKNTNFILLKGKNYSEEVNEIDLNKYTLNTYPSLTSEEARIICLKHK